MIQDIVFSISKFLEDRYLSRYILILTKINNNHSYIIYEDLVSLMRETLENIIYHVDFNIDTRILKNIEITNKYSRVPRMSGDLYMSGDLCDRYIVDSYDSERIHDYVEIPIRYITNPKISLWLKLIWCTCVDGIRPPSNTEIMNEITRTLMDDGFFEDLDIDPLSIRVPLKYIDDSYPNKDYIRRCYEFEDRPKKIIIINNPTAEQIYMYANEVLYFDLDREYDECYTDDRHLIVDKIILENHVVRLTVSSSVDTYIYKYFNSVKYNWINKKILRISV